MPGKNRAESGARDVAARESPAPRGTRGPASRAKSPSARAQTARVRASDRGPVRDRKTPIDFGRALVEAWLTNERINQVLLDRIDPAIWDLAPPCSKRRTIATTFAHVQNVRRMRVAASAGDGGSLAKLDRATITIDEARSALAASAAAMARVIERSIEGGGHVKGFRPDVVALVCLSITHEAHHRGQVCHWARELGQPISIQEQLELWDWNKRWKEAARA